MAAPPSPRTLGKLYFAAQGVAGIAWWVAVPLSDTVRRATLGARDPLLVGLLDIPLFVVTSLLVAFGLRWAVWVVTPWTLLITATLALYATITGLAGWGAIIMIAASAFGIWSAVSMARDGEGTPLPSAMAHRLVVRGTYRFVRNPMAVSGILQGAAVGLMLGSWLTVAYAVEGSLVWNWVIRPHEERDLEARFGDAFREYRDRVACWVPRYRKPRYTKKSTRI